MTELSVELKVFGLVKCTNSSAPLKQNSGKKKGVNGNISLV